MPLSEARKNDEVISLSDKAVEQMYKDLHGDEKLQKALEAASDMLLTKGITISDIELRLLIEAAVAEFNDAFNKTGTATDTEATV